MGALSLDPPDFSHSAFLSHLCMFSLPFVNQDLLKSLQEKFFVSMHPVRVAVKADRLIEGHSVFMFHVLLTDWES